jgi:hypothetical protein
MRFCRSLINFINLIQDRYFISRASDRLLSQVSFSNSRLIRFVALEPRFICVAFKLDLPLADALKPHKSIRAVNIIHLPRICELESRLIYVAVTLDLRLADALLHLLHDDEF